MDEKAFKKHLQDLAHGRHHPDEHDWQEPKKAPRKAAARKTKPKAKRAA
jgi:hypothetical protein